MEQISSLLAAAAVGGFAALRTPRPLYGEGRGRPWGTQADPGVSGGLQVLEKCRHV